MAMYHALFPPHLLQLMGQQQSLQHHFADGLPPRQRPLILHNHGAPHFEQHPQLNCPLELLQLMGLDIPTSGNICNYTHRQNRGCQRDRINSNPLSGMPPPLQLNYRAEGSYAKKSYWNKDVQRLISKGNDYNSKMTDYSAPGYLSPKSTHDKNIYGKCSTIKNPEKDNEKGSRIDSKGIKRQHEFYPKVYSSRGNLNAGNNNYYNGQGQNSYDYSRVTGVGCSIPGAEGGPYQSGIHGNKRRFQMDHRSFLFRSQRGRKMFTVGLGPGNEGQDSLLDRGFLRFPGMSGIVAPIAPDRFLSRAHLVHVKGQPPALYTGGEWDKLSEGIWEKFIANQQSEETFRKKMLLWKCLYQLIKSSFPRYGLYLVGSTMSGFGSNNSDVDMCLLVRYSEMDQRNEAVGHLEQILQYLRKYEFIHNAELIQAKVPILKFRDSKQGLEVDLNCNNSVGIRNTHLLYCYSQLDWRVRPLVLIVKLWAHKHNINDAKNMTVSSYSLALMVINYLQCGVTPPVLPCLHVMYQGKFSPHSDIHRIDLLEELCPYTSENTKSLGELFLGFLYYYAFIFDFSQDAISVRLASKISIEDCRRVRTYKNDPHQWKYLCIEEPFDLTNTARSVYDKDVFERVKHVFRTSWEKLNDIKIIDCLFEDEKD